MYLDIQKDPQRDSKWTIFVLVLAVAFVMFCATCNGQICVSHKQNTNYYSPCSPIVLKTISDTSKKVALGMFVDGDKTVVYLDYFNKDNSSKDLFINIGLVGGKVITVKAEPSNDINHAEFVLPTGVVEKMKLARLDYFATESIRYYKPWLIPYPESYFMDFLNNYKKKVDVEILGITYRE